MNQACAKLATTLTESRGGLARTLAWLPCGQSSGYFFLQVVVQLSEDLLSQAVMMVENSRPTLAINLSGARQYWLEGMLRHEIGQHVEHVGGRWADRSEEPGMETVRWDSHPCSPFLPF